MLGRLFSIGLASATILAAGAHADIDHVSRDGVWSQLDQMPPDVQNGTPWIRPVFGQVLMFDDQALADALRGVPLEGTPDEIAPVVVWFPRPDGSFERFYVVESPIMTPDFAAARPDIKTYMGWGIDDPYATTRFDKTPEGFHAQVFTLDGAWYVDPYTKGDSTFYTSYFKRDYVKLDAPIWHCDATGDPVPVGEGGEGGISDRVVVTRREYRLALAADAEYTAVFALAGDTDTQKKTRAQAAMVTSINRVNQVYEAELAVRLNLINNTAIIYTNSATDPYTDNNGSAMLGQNQTAIDTNIGSANYDIGHVFSTGGGGIAQLGVVCSAGNKAKGVTGSSSPRGDSYDIDYVAHEMGHQFNAPHCFAGVVGACAGNGSSGNFYEIGSGSTVMCYAGICGTDDIQAHSDPYFHHSSITIINSFTASGGGSGCDAPFATTNNPPTATAGSNLTIPTNTPFFLTPATFSDPDGDAITYEWEQHDSVQHARPTTDPGTGAIFRPRVPVASPTQYFPPLANVVAGTLAAGDMYPATNRTLNFRLTVRDNRAGGGGTFTTAANRVITVVTTAGPFAVTAPNTVVSIAGNSNTTVTWNVANTTAAPVNCANVDVLLSIDGGVTFPNVLASAVPNSGSAVVTLPSTGTNLNACRIMVRGSSHIFYDVSNVNFRILANASPPNTPTAVTANPTSVCPSQTTQLSATVGAGEVVDWYTGSCGGTLVGTGSPLVVTPPATTTYFARARRTSDSQVSASCGSVVVTLTPNPVAPSSATTDRTNFCSDDAGDINLTAIGGSGTTARWFSGSCGGTLVGTGSPLVIASPTASTTYFVRWETTCGNSSCASIGVNVLPAATPPSSVTSDRLQLCPGDTGSITLSATGGSGTTLNWYSGTCGGTLVGTGSPLTIPSPSVTTNYYARWTNACGNSVCAPFVTVAVGPPASDFNGDGAVDFFDYDEFVTCFEGGVCPPGKTADFNNDTSVDFFDYDEFVAAYEIGC